MNLGVFLLFAQYSLLGMSAIYIYIYILASALRWSKRETPAHTFKNNQGALSLCSHSCRLLADSFFDMREVLP